MTINESPLTFTLWANERIPYNVPKVNRLFTLWVNGSRGQERGAPVEAALNRTAESCVGQFFFQAFMKVLNVKRCPSELRMSASSRLSAIAFPPVRLPICQGFKGLPDFLRQNDVYVPLIRFRREDAGDAIGNV